MIYLFFFVLTEVVYLQNISHTKFQEFMKSSKGCVLHIEFKQTYNDETLISSGVFYKKGESYIYDNKNQYVKYENQYLTTINKLNKQVVLDSMKKNNATIFDILSGNEQSIFFHPPTSQTDRIHIPFEIELWGIKGSIWTDKIDGAPKKITFTQDEEIKVDIDIIQSTNDSIFNPPTYDIMDYEVINLIE